METRLLARLLPPLTPSHPSTSCALAQLVLPYWMESEERADARWKLAGVVALTLATTGVRCEAVDSDSSGMR